MTERHQVQRWAARTEFGDGVHPLAEAVAQARAAGVPLIDLTVSNPTRCGFRYDAEAIFAGLDAAVSPDRLLLTGSTSEAYGYLLRLLCDADDEILVPQPSYPLFDLLAWLNDVRLQPYPLLRHDGWRIDLDALRRTVSPRTRAIVLVHPNNPTGHTVDAEERRQVAALAAEFGLAMIVDEVFLDFAVEGHAPRSFAAGDTPVLTFVLSGLSKVLALPQMKLAWIVVCGPAGACDEAMRRLEFIADTFLSPNAPVQHAVGHWMALAAPMQAQILERVRANLRSLDGVLAKQALCSRLPVQAGWCVVLRVPATVADEELALLLLQQKRIVVHPGSFYGLLARGWLILSLLPPVNAFEEGVDALMNGVSILVNEEAALTTTVENVGSSGS